MQLCFIHRVRYAVWSRASAATWYFCHIGAKQRVLIVCALYAFRGGRRGDGGSHVESGDDGLERWYRLYCHFQAMRQGTDQESMAPESRHGALSRFGLTGLIVIIGGQFISGVEVTTLDAWREYAARVGWYP